jgi:hypothetical protein
MPGEEQERFEDYLELERYIEELQAGRAAHPPKGLTRDQASIYRMAALFRSASPDAVTPPPEFANELYARLLALGSEDQAGVEVHKGASSALGSASIYAELSEDQAGVEGPQKSLLPEDDEDTVKRPIVGAGARPEVAPEPAARLDQRAIPTGQAPEDVQQPAAPEVSVVVRRNVSGKGRVVGRRSLFTHGAAAAASLTVGAGIGAALMREQPKQAPARSPVRPYGTFLLSEGAPTTWHYVTTLAELGDQVLQFATDTLVGYVIANDGDEKDVKGEVVAMSAACTHMGCIIEWRDADRRYHCPCHDWTFSEYGKAVPENSYSALPLLRTKVVDGKIYVEVPKSSSK